MRPVFRWPMRRTKSTKGVTWQADKVRRIFELRVRSNDSQGARLINSLYNAATRLRQRVSVRRVRALRHNTRRHIAKLNRLRRLFDHRPKGRQGLIRSHKVFENTGACRPRVVPLSLRFDDPLRNQVKHTVTLVTRNVRRRDSNRRTIGTLFGPIFTRYFVMTIASNNQIQAGEG